MENRPRVAPRPAPVALLALALLATVLVSADAGPGRRALSGSTPRMLHVSKGSCGTGWHPGRAGRQRIPVHNDGSWTVDVHLLASGTRAMRAEIEGLGPGVTRTLRVRLAAGHYRVRCQVDGHETELGPGFRLAGPGHGGPAVRPVTHNDLYGPAKTYHRRVTTRLATLASRGHQLRRALQSGSREAARTAWTRAHLAYERLGAAYDAFGDLGDRVNGRPTGLPEGVHDQDFTGFRRIEHGLWRHEPLPNLAHQAKQLEHDIRTLRRSFRRTRIQPLDLALRAHEILEDTQRFALAGRADQGSGTALATASANVRGTRDVLRVLRPVLRGRYPDTERLDRWLDRTDRLVRAQHRHGHWTPLDELSHTERQRINGAVAQTLELLAPIAEICAPRRVS